MICAGAALPSAHSRTARSGTCASARASDTHTYKGTAQHTPAAGLLLRRTDDKQTDTDCDALNCARASARARRGGTTTADFSSTHTGEPLHKGAGPPPRRAGNQPTDSDHDTPDYPDCARSRAHLYDNNTSASEPRYRQRQHKEGPRRPEERERGLKTTSLRNHEELRRAVFEHRHSDTAGRHQQRWRAPETRRSHRTAVVGKRACALHLCK
jgi:hypothetical protein